MLVGYMRVSSADDRQSVDLQRDALVAAGVDERHLYADRASGARDDRPGLKACLAYLRPGDGLVVWKLDRLGRSLPHLLAIMAELRARGITFRSLTEQMDTATPHGELLFSIFGALAQYERALARERVLAGLAAARRRGARAGVPRPSTWRRSSRSSPRWRAAPARLRCAALDPDRHAGAGRLGGAGGRGQESRDGAALIGLRSGLLHGAGRLGRRGRRRDPQPRAAGSLLRACWLECLTSNLGTRTHR